MSMRGHVAGSKMRFQVRVCWMTDGERLPLVIDARGLPVPTPNQWALLLRRPQVQAGTLTDEIRTVAHVHDWADRRGIDLDERFASGNGLRPAEVNALYQNLRYVRPYADMKATGVKLRNIVNQRWYFQ